MHLFIGRSFYFKKEYTEALNWLINATSLANGDQNAWILRANAAIKAENYKEARFTLNQMHYYLNTISPTVLSQFEKKIKSLLLGILKKVRQLVANNETELAWQLNASILSESPDNKQALKMNKLILRKINEQLREIAEEDSSEKLKVAQLIFEKDNNNIQALRVLAIN